MNKFKLGDLVRIKESKNIFTHPCKNINEYHFHTNCYYEITEDKYKDKIGTIINIYNLSSTYNFGNSIWLYKNFKYKTWNLILLDNNKFWISDEILELI